MTRLTFSYSISQKLGSKLLNRDAFRQTVMADTEKKFDLDNERLTDDHN